jgi:hypothetical protein
MVELTMVESTQLKVMLGSHVGTPFQSTTFNGLIPPGSIKAEGMVFVDTVKSVADCPAADCVEKIWFGRAPDLNGRVLTSRNLEIRVPGDKQPELMLEIGDA